MQDVPSFITQELHQLQGLVRGPWAPWLAPDQVHPYQCWPPKAGHQDDVHLGVSLTYWRQTCLVIEDKC